MVLYVACGSYLFTAILCIIWLRVGSEAASVRGYRSGPLRLSLDLLQCMQWIPEHEADVAILEEPEHLNWYQHGRRWTDKFNHVVGIMHTNYLDYARREENGAVKAAILRAVNSLVCRVHCHKVIKLSDAVQRLPRQCVEFVHGVSPRFLEVGAQKAQAAKLIRDVAASTSEAQPWGKGAYFLGKVVWAKGYTELLDLLEQHKARCGQDIAMHVYGSGDDASVRPARLTVALVPCNAVGCVCTTLSSSPGHFQQSVSGPRRLAESKVLQGAMRSMSVSQMLMCCASLNRNVGML